jgi:D-glycero-D-manno-heptose 1,7-bisphosphate phosphatase
MPKTILEAAKKYNVNLSQSYFIGDAPSDLDCAIQAGCHPVLLLTGRGTSTVEQIEKYPIKVTIFNELYATVELI